MSRSHKMEQFADWVSPMLVKELRQGLRSNTFIITFLVVQVLLCFAFLLAVGSDNPMSSANKAGEFIFFIFLCLVIVIQPLRAISSLSSELKDGHMELISLTQLSSWRTIWSKWSAVMLQSILIFVAILPFIMVRYFFGGLDVFKEMIMYGLGLVFSGGFVAAMIMISGLKVVGLRILVVLAVVFLGIVAFISMIRGVFFDFRFESLAITDWSLWLFIGLTSVGVAYLIYIFLTAAVRIIAPVAENHSTLVRIISLGLLLFITVFCLFTPWGLILEDWHQFVISAFFVLTLSLLCLTERSAEVSSFLAIKKKTKFTLLHWLTAPGWQFGFWSVTLASLLFLSIAHGYSNGNDYEEMMGVFFLLNATAFFPRVFLPLIRKPVTVLYYMTTLVVLSILTIGVLAVSESYSFDADWLGWIFLPLPPISIPLLLDGGLRGENETVFFYSALVVLLFYWGLTAISALLSIRSQLRGLKS